MPSPAKCSRQHPNRQSGPVGPTGWRLSDHERLVLGENHCQQLHSLWTALHGSSDDFDDLYIQTATNTGWVRNDTDRLDELLNDAAEHLCNIPWGILRIIAVDSYEAHRGNSVPYPIEKWDRRRWEELVDDAQFHNGTCRLCEKWATIPEEHHRQLAQMVASGHKTWEQIDQTIQKALQQNPNGTENN